MKKTRRTFLKDSGQAALGFGLLGLTSCDVDSTKKVKKEPTKKEIKEIDNDKPMTKIAKPIMTLFFFEISSFNLGVLFLCRWSLAFLAIVGWLLFLKYS